MRASWVTALCSVPDAVLRSTTLTLPSFPGKVLMTLPMGQWLGRNFPLGLMATMSSACRLLVVVCHFVLACSELRYSLDHLVQNCWMTAWHRLHFLSNWRLDSGVGSSGYIVGALFIRKCPAVRVISPSGLWLVSGRRGLLLRQASILQEMVESSSNVNLEVPITL